MKSSAVSTTRKIKVQEEAPESAEIQRLRKLEQINQKMAALIVAEKRWLRKFRLAVTKLDQNRAAQGRLEKQRKTLK